MWVDFKEIWYVLCYMQAISADHSSVDECFAVIIHKCLTVHKDSAHQVLIKALRSKVVGKDDIADDFEKEIERWKGAQKQCCGQI